MLPESTAQRSAKTAHIATMWLRSLLARFDLKRHIGCSLGQSSLADSRARLWASQRFALDSWLSLRYTQSCCQSADSFKETGAHFYAQAHISTQPPPPCENTRVPGAHEDQGRRCRVEPPPCHWPQARCSQRRLPRLTLPCRSARLSCICLLGSGMRCLTRPFRIEPSGNAMNSHPSSLPSLSRANRWRRPPAQACRLSARLCGRTQAAIRIDELVSGAAIGCRHLPAEARASG